MSSRRFWGGLEEGDKVRCVNRGPEYEMGVKILG